jgi:hypothetical protein
MKRLLKLATMSAIALALPISGIAAPPKKDAAAAATGEAKKAADKTAAAAKDTTAAAEAKVKPLPMNAKVDAVDAAAKTFSHNNKNGTTVKFVVTDKTEIKNNGADAKFEDIKVGDTVAGLRLKKSNTEYEVVKITKFGAVAPKEKKPAEKKGEAKPEAAKPQ